MPIYDEFEMHIRTRMDHAHPPVQSSRKLIARYSQDRKLRLSLASGLGNHENVSSGAGKMTILMYVLRESMREVPHFCLILHLYQYRSCNFLQMRKTP